MSQEKFMKTAVEIAIDGVLNNSCGPFGAVIVKNDEIVGQGVNMVTSSNDPTAHAEVSAIRSACAKLKDFSLAGCDIYTSCEPCPMCLGAIYWARIDRIFYGATRKDAAKINFDDGHFYSEMTKEPHERKIPMKQISREQCIKIFEAWEALESRTHY